MTCVGALGLWEVARPHVAALVADRPPGRGCGFYDLYVDSHEQQFHADPAHRRGQRSARALKLVRARRWMLAAGPVAGYLVGFAG